MKAASSRLRKKSSPKVTPEKGQKTLSSFLAKFTQKRSPDSSHVSAGSQAESASSKERGNKRKLDPSNLGNNSNQPKLKRSPIFDSAKNDQSENQELSHNLNSDCLLIGDGIPLLKSKNFTNVENKERIFSPEKRTKKHSSDLISSKKQSSPELYSKSQKADKPKKFSPLKSDSQNIQLALSEEEQDNVCEESLVIKGEKIPSSSLLSDSKNDRRSSNEKKIANEVDRPKEEASGFDDDNFLFQAFDTSFKIENEVTETKIESGSQCQTKSTLTDDFEDVFSDDWNEDFEVDVDLTKLQRCKVSSIARDKFYNLILNVLHVDSQNPVTVTLMGFWKEARVKPGDIVNIQAIKQSNAWVVDNNSGLVIEQPDYLVSGTSVVGALFCARRGALSDRFKGIESVTDCKQGASLMVIGSLVHELLQEVLRKKIYTKPGIAKLLKDILKSQETASSLYSASMSTESCEKEMTPFVSKIFNFIERYVKDKTSQPKDNNFDGKINAVRDIEENFWVPQLGIKGKVDVTVEVKVNLRRRIMPLELKTGRASFSLEHRGQIILYSMMMAITGQEVDAGLLLYLRENIMHEIRVGHPEQRDLILLRNNLAYYLTRQPQITSQINSGIHSQSQIESMELPKPINHPACQNCPYTTLCCTYLKDDKNYTISDRHPLIPIMQELDSYLKPEHIEYVMNWVKMLQIEEADQANDVQPLNVIWTVPPKQREKQGKCISNLKIIGKVIEGYGRFPHTFIRNSLDDHELTKDFTKSGFNLREYIIISTNTKINVSAGPIIELHKDSLTVLLERNLEEKKPNEIFHIDGYTSQNLLIINLSNVGYLLENNSVTDKLRKIVIERAPGTFLKQLDRSWAIAAAKILKPLNKTQRRAVLKVLTANEYLLIKGMPGSGKTVTLVAIIELLVHLGKSVLLTAHTNSAVDNVLLKLMKTDVDFVRLGSTNKIHPLLLSKSESVLTQDCYTPESLDKAYNSKNVVCVTCLAANHPLLGKRMFDVCLVDESTQVLQSSVLRPLYSASKFVLIGDPNQLPPVVRSKIARELGMDQSLFQRLDSENNTITLTSQYRMNQRIMSVANKVTYKNQLIVGSDEIGNATLDIPNKMVLNSCRRWVQAALSTDLDNSVVVLDTGDKYNIMSDVRNSESDNYHAERRCSNLCEAAIILHLVTVLIEAGVVAEKIGIISPYREQVKLLGSIVKQDVEVNTVDQYQGRDKEIILYSGTRSSIIRSKGGEQFNILDDHRRLTVAITRAKHKLIVIGDVKTLKEFGPFEKFFSQIRSKDLISLKDGCADFMWEELLSVVKK